jgi:hypothetical protein
MAPLEVRLFLIFGRNLERVLVLEQRTAVETETGYA